MMSLRQEKIMQVFENKLLRRNFDPRGVEQGMEKIM
jgi:hypothetical protein